MSTKEGCFVEDDSAEIMPSESKKPRLDCPETPTAESQDLSQPSENVNDAKCPQDEKEESEQSVPDPLSYTRGKEFTSEIFKIQIHNLPKFGFTDLKKRLKSLGLNPNKIKSPDRQSVAYICFRNKEERDKALETVNGHVWKNHTLEAKIAAPIADPYLQKRKEAKGNGSHAVSSEAKDLKEISPEEAEERLRGNVCPLWNMDYSQQLKMKTEKIKSVLCRISKDNLVKWMFRNIKIQYEGMPCELLPIIPSPETAEYRNKNEFTVGYGLDGKTIVVGFRYGLYKDGTTAVGDCSNLKVAMPVAIPVVKSFTEFVSKSQWTPFVQHAGTGHWQTLTVRTFRTGDVMVMADFVPRDLEQSEIEDVKVSLKDFYTVGEGSKVGIKSFYFRVMGRKGSSSGPDVQLLFGEQHVHESLLNLKFRISPQAFFQVNTPATEKLYSLIADWCETSPTTTVLDVCCGTGTIGLAVAKKVKEVIGIEMCAEAVEDARANATINGVSNAKYHCNKVEDVIHNILSSTESSLTASNDIVAVVDPPRAGLHKDVIRVLRRCTRIQRLIYVSCNPENALSNFIDLIRPETGRHKGSPYILDRAVPVDLFPGTKHCELVLLFMRERQTSSSSPATADAVQVQPPDVDNGPDETRSESSSATNPANTSGCGNNNEPQAISVTEKSESLDAVKEANGPDNPGS